MAGQGVWASWPVALGLMVAAASLGASDGTAAAPCSVVETIGPVLPNETVLTVLSPATPQVATSCFAPSEPVAVMLCPPASSSSCLTVLPLKVARRKTGGSVVHWTVPEGIELAEWRYSVCSASASATTANVGALCTTLAPLNAAAPAWMQCVSATPQSPPWHNGLVCSPGVSTLRVFGTSLAFANGRGVPYASPKAERQPVDDVGRVVVRLTLQPPSGSLGSGDPVEISAATQSAYDATFSLPSSLVPGVYAVEVKSTLPNATWTTSRDSDQRTINITAVASAFLPSACAPTATLKVHDRDSLVAALATAAHDHPEGVAVALAAGVYNMHETDVLAIPDCTVVKGEGMSATVLVWPNVSGLCKVGGSRPRLVGASVGGVGPITVSDLGVVVSAGGFGSGCPGVIGAHGGSGHTFARLNVTMYDVGPSQHVFGSAVSLEDTSNVLVEDCTFLHCGNSTPGDAHAGVNSPILSASRSSSLVIRNNLWQVGLSGWHIDQSWHVVMESNTFTGYFDNDPARPLPNMDGAFWFSSYGQGPFPGAGRFFYANTTQNERPHTKPQVGGGESFTLDGGNDGGYYGPVVDASRSDGASADSNTVTVAGDVCWHHVGGYTPADCSTTVSPWVGGRTGHVALILTGPGQGQWRRVVGVSGTRNRTVHVDAPFDPSPTAASTLQIGPFRGQIMIVGGHFQAGGTMQLYAACYDCVVAENTFGEFGFSNWGRNPHGFGWQPNLNNLVADNVMLGRDGRGTMGVLGCSQSCSDADGGHCSSIRPPHDGACSGNATSLPGRDCAIFGSDAFDGAVNQQISWRRNAMTTLGFSNNGPLGFPVVDAGVVEHTRWISAPPGTPPPPPLDLNRTANVLVRD
jgi:hypothetical protein